MQAPNQQDMAETLPKKRKIPIYPGFPELERSDVSIYPTYSKLGLDYRVVCRHRYHWAKVKQTKQFTKELQSYEMLQPNALGGIRVHREFTQGILVHKIQPKRYMQRLTPDPLTTIQRMRLEAILSGEVNFKCT